jgi:hypothetical protein
MLLRLDKVVVAECSPGMKTQIACPVLQREKKDRSSLKSDPGDGSCRRGPQCGLHAFCLLCFIYLYFICMEVLPTCTYEQLSVSLVLTEARRDCWIPWN